MINTTKTLENTALISKLSEENKAKNASKIIELLNENRAIKAKENEVKTLKK